ncbi:MAG: T9SS type A sorting domain-containing protein [Krumholzibacteria bacterium]|nr:T9SS type A sorting domain-containing protein [Candidatus Krumholzibacteria bacterium]
MVPGIKNGRPDSATIPPGSIVNFEGAGRAGATAMGLTSLTVNGTLRGVSSAVPISIKTTGDITIGAGGHVGGSVANVSKNNITLEAGGAVAVNGTVEGQRGAVVIKATGNISVGGSGRVQSQQRSVNVVSRSGAVSVAAGGSVIARQGVGIQAGPGQPTRIDGLVRSERGNVAINGGLRQNRAGNVTIGLGGRVEAPNGEVIVTADTLRVAGTISGRTVQKKCNVVIIEPGGSIEGKGSEKDKVAAKEKVEPRADPAQPAKKAQVAQVVGGDHCVIDYMGAGGLVIEAEDFVRVATGPLGTIDLRGNPPAVPVINCPGPIEIFADEILLEPGVALQDICGPGPVVTGPGQPIVEVACLAMEDTVGYPGMPSRVGFLVSNMGNVGESFTLSVFDELGWGVAPPPPVVWLAADDVPPDTLIRMPVEVPPWVEEDVDTNRIWLEARSASNPGVFYSESFTLPVRRVAELKDVDVSPWGVDGAAAAQETVHFHLWIANNGQLPDDYGLEVGDREGWPPEPFDPWTFLPAWWDTVIRVSMVVPPGIPTGFTNELYVTARSLSSPEVASTDTIAFTVGGQSAVPPAVPGAAAIVHRCWPNPFNPRVVIGFSLPEADLAVRITVYDLEGRRIRELWRGVVAGRDGRVDWDGLDGAGNPAASGVYFYRITGGGHAATGKMLLAR